MNPARKYKFQCPTCEELYHSRLEAEDCCPQEADRVTCWECAECGGLHQDEDKARYCCLDEDVVLPATPMQLEAAGQQRLPI
jgi:hypothetical protein